MLYHTNIKQLFGVYFAVGWAVRLVDRGIGGIIPQQQFLTTILFVSNTFIITSFVLYPLLLLGLR